MKTTCSPRVHPVFTLCFFDAATARAKYEEYKPEEATHRPRNTPRYTEIHRDTQIRQTPTPSKCPLSDISDIYPLGATVDA